MSTLMDKLYEGSYNGIPFLMPSGEMTQGRKTVTHEYPNQTYRYVEDLGKNLRTFNIQAIITGSDYFIRREALITALNIGGIGVLVHPFYGVTTAVCKTYTISEDTTRLGECNFNITFEESFPNVFPLALGSTISTAISLINTAAVSIQGDVGSSFYINPSSNNSTSFPFQPKYGAQKITAVTAANQCVSLYNSLNTIIEPLNTSNNALNIFKDKNNDFYNKRFTLIQDSASLASTMYDLISSFDDIALDADYGYTINSSVYEFGVNDIYPSPTTTDRIERIKNSKIFNSAVNAFLLLNLYNNAILINYTNETQLSSIFNNLEQQYQYLISNNNLSNDTLLLLKKIRVTANNILKTISVNTAKIVNIAISPSTPLSVLLYNYYENFNNENQIVSLNNIFDSTVIEGSIQMLSS